MGRNEFYEILSDEIFSRLEEHKEEFKNRDDVFDFIEDIIDDYTMELESAINEIADDYCDANDYYDED